MTPRGTIQSARLTRVAVPLLLASLALSSCSDGEPTAAPSASTSASTSTTPSATPSESSPSVTPTQTPTVTATVPATPTAPPTIPTPTPSKTTEPPASTPTPTRTPNASCPASRSGSTKTQGMSSAAAAKAKKIHAAAKSCNASALIALAKADATGLVGDKAPAAIFTASSPQNYVALSTLLTMEPTETFDGTIQPKVFSERFAQDDSEWDKVVAAGLLTSAGATKMRQDDGGYTGYRVGIAGDGTWTFFITGR